MTDSIGVFDSGVGGLSVLREIRQALPDEDLAYVADSGAAPYGDRPAAFIAARAESIAGFLIGEGAKAIVVACNTATAVAVRALRSTFTVPIVAIEPAVKPASEASTSGVIGILATSQTLASASFSRLAERYGTNTRILLQPCPGLVEQIERGELDGSTTRTLVERYVQPLVEQGADTIVLGCTHYPFVRPLIASVAGPGVSLLDPAVAVARQLQRRLTECALLSEKTGQQGGERFWTTGIPAHVEPVVGQLWGTDVRVHALPPRFAVQ